MYLDEIPPENMQENVRMRTRDKGIDQQQIERKKKEKREKVIIEYEVFRQRKRKKKSIKISWQQLRCLRAYSWVHENVRVKKCDTHTRAR